MERRELKAVLEALLFVAPEPLPLKRLREVLPEVPEEEIRAAMQDLGADYGEGRGVQLVEVAGGYRLVTRPDYSAWVKAYEKIKTATRLSRSAMETLAVIAYRQPVTRPEIEAVRGVDCAWVLGTLLQRRLVRITGRQEAVGRPLLYGTTTEFMEYFGLKDLTELPPLKEFQTLVPQAPLDAAAGASV
jgi:segregation and condensation protein B